MWSTVSLWKCLPSMMTGSRECSLCGCKFLSILVDLKSKWIPLSPGAQAKSSVVLVPKCQMMSITIWSCLCSSGNSYVILCVFFYSWWWWWWLVLLLKPISWCCLLCWPAISTTLHVAKISPLLMFGRGGLCHEGDKNATPMHGYVIEL